MGNEEGEKEEGEEYACRRREGGRDEGRETE